MHVLEPTINLLVLLSVLSVAAERLANLVKPARADWDGPHGPPWGAVPGDRERRIANRVLAVSVLLALVVKADFFAIAARLDAPWETLGWTRAATASPARLLTTILGTIVTGLSLGFGSKFWHDLLDIVYGARDNLRRHARGERVAIPGPSAAREDAASLAGSADGLGRRER